MRSQRPFKLINGMKISQIVKLCLKIAIRLDSDWYMNILEIYISNMCKFFNQDRCLFDRINFYNIIVTHWINKLISSKLIKCN